MNHILVPTDFGASARRAADYAAELASKLGAKITLLHVWSVPTPSYAGSLSWPIDGIEAGARASLEREHARLVAQHRDTDAVLAAGTGWDRIVEIATERDVDWIVMGTHGRQGVPRWFLGSVAERVVRMSPVPVLTVRASSASEA